MLKKYTFDGSKKLKLKDLPTDSKKDKVNKEKIIEKFQKNLEEMERLQEKFYADGTEGLIVVLQALDAAGKDSTIRHVMTVLNPQGVNVVSFKAPNSEELAHDYLWRIHKNVPARGGITIFNRSHYEDVIAVQVLGLHKTYKMAERVIDEDDDKFFRQRYEQIQNFEEYLYQNSYRVVKIFLNVSKAEQKERFLERIDRPEKNWKFNPGDLADRKLFGRYLDTFEEVINATATKHSPWYVLPADQKWYTRYLVSEIMVNALKACDPQFPELSKDDLAKMADCKAALLAEK